MMWRKRKKENEEGRDDLIAGRIARLLLRCQHGFASRMSRLFEGLSPGRIKVLTVSFFVISGITSTYLIVDNLFHPGTSARLIKVQQIKMPVYDADHSQTVGRTDCLSIRQLYTHEKYLDSLQAYGDYAAGISPDRVRQLLDSIRLLKRIYQSTSK